MEKYQKIISKKRISVSDIYAGIYIMISPLIMFFLGLYAIYSVNHAKSDPSESNLIFYQWIFIAFSLFCIYLIYVSWRKLRVFFFQNLSAIEKKEHALQKIKIAKYWRIEKEDKNYILFFDQNLPSTSYYITIVYNEKGFYINCYPAYGRVIDLGLSSKYTRSVYEDLCAYL